MVIIKIAIISDIHSNQEALKATFEDIEKRKVDKIICLGDIIAKGTHPSECVKLIKEKCEIVIQGNCDRNFAKEYIEDDDIPDLEKTRIKWNQSMLTKEERKYLLNLQFSYEFYMSGSLVRLFHATPDSDHRTVLNVDKLKTKVSMFRPTERTISQDVADVVIYGHIHHQYMEKLYNKTLINVGSVGNSFETIRNRKIDSNVLEITKSNYLIIEGDYGNKEYGEEISFQFVRVSYDIDKELENENINIEKEKYRRELKEGRYRDIDKVNKNFKELGVEI